MCSLWKASEEDGIFWKSILRNKMMMPRQMSRRFLVFALE